MSNKELFEKAAKPQQTEEVDLIAVSDDPMYLIIWNDEINTFEWVIETLIDVCKHTQEQAEQCAYLIHTKGKYAVKNGDYDTLKPMCDAILDRGINATIESTVY
ncbi:MAG: ATP-dependent Clp protease adaptor ClpS [Arachidicoccus sp.]|nr:ATP-dependent Clp protease adaptor ClpS [Arachidicoccus sp.]